MTPKQIEGELKRIGKHFRKQQRLYEKAALVERNNDCNVTGAEFEGRGYSFKYCAEHVEALVALMSVGKREP